MKAHEQSSGEGLRLSRELKQMTALNTTREAKLAELQAKVDETPPFKILSKEELDQLGTAEQVDYSIKKHAWERDKVTNKEKAEALQADAQKAQEADLSFIYDRSSHMANNPKDWPDYNTLVPTMETILDRAPFMGGNRASPEILYFCARGLQAHREAKAQTTLKAQADADAAATAAAQAAAAGTGAPVAPAGPAATPPNLDPDSDEAHNARILGKSQIKPIFGA